MTVQPVLTPARAARRQLLVDRFAEYLAERCGSEERAAGYATDLRDIVEALGWSLPAALDDPPPPPAASTVEGRAAARALFEQTRAATRGT